MNMMEGTRTAWPDSVTDSGQAGRARILLRREGLEISDGTSLWHAWHAHGWPM